MKFILNSGYRIQQKYSTYWLRLCWGFLCLFGSSSCSKNIFENIHIRNLVYHIIVRLPYLLTSFVDVSFLECEPSNFPVIRNIQTHHDNVV